MVKTCNRSNMFPQKLVKVKVLVLLVILAQLLALQASASSTSKSKSKSSKAKSSSQRQRSGHQYAPLLMKPSKPDPHFEILDEQRGINYSNRLRDGREGSKERKPSRLSEVASSSSSRRSATSAISSTNQARKGKKEREKSIVMHPASIESTFMKKSTEVAERTQPSFAGSALVSGDAGPLSHSYSRRTELVEKDGWKILMGPSVSPEESGVYGYENENAENRRTFTSMTDGVGKHRTITKLKPVKKGKSISNSSNKLYDMNEISSSKKINKLIDAERRESGASVRKGTPKRTMQVSIPKQTLKHKYATITRRAPSKSTDAIQRATETIRKPSQTSSKLLKPSKLIKSSLETRYASLENDVNKYSPVMTLDTKKLVIQPVESSAEPTAFSRGTTSMSTENFYEEQQPTQSSSPSYNLESRYDPMNIGDITTEIVDGNHDSPENRFQTKTALNSAEYPLISVSASMNYPANHPKEQGGIITASSFSNMHHHVEESDNFPQISPSHLAQAPEPALRNPFLEETDNFNDNASPVSPHVEFVGIDSNLRVQPPPHGHAGASRLPLHSGRVNSKLTPSHHRFPLELPPHHPDFHFHGSIVPSENSFVTADRYPHFPVGTRIQPPTLHDVMARPPPEPIPSNAHATLHSLPPPGHNHRIPMLPIHPRHHHHPPHRHHRRPPPPPPPHLLPLGPHVGPPPQLDVGSGRKAAPPQDFVIEIGNVPPGHSPPPPPGVDPDHPAVQHALKNPHTILNDGIFIEPTDSTNIQETTKNYLHNLHYQVHKNTLIPLDKRLVYLFMVFSWMFWITTFYTYYRWSATGNKAKKIILNVPKDGDSPQVTARALDSSSQWNITPSKILEYIEIAQKTYEGFDWQDLNCQKRTLCELVQKQNEPWGETGRKLANSYVYRFVDSLDGLPIPQMIQTYLKEYKEAISQGKNSSKDCGQVYSGCKFSIKEVLHKAAAKKKA